MEPKICLFTELRGDISRHIPNLREGQHGSKLRHIVLSGNHRVGNELERVDLGDIGSSAVTALALRAVANRTNSREDQRAGWLRDRLAENPLDTAALRYLADEENCAGDTIKAGNLLLRALELSPAYLGARAAYAGVSARF